MGSSLGTLFEWYDFNLYVLLAVPIGLNFFSSFPEETRAIFALLIFAVGFLIRPVGALVFGRLSDRIGRRVMFLATVVIMGVATVLVGILPGNDVLGIWAPVLLILLRMAQGFAVGGEYAGAAVYLAEHVPTERRGYFTSYIQATITMATLIALMLILFIRSTMSDADFATWGWRIPFLLGALPLLFSVWLRLRLAESPVFAEMRKKNTLSADPLRETLTNGRTLRTMLIVLFGLVAGQAVLAYGGQIYPFIFMQSVLKVDFLTATVLQSWALLVAVLGFVLFGWLSDKIGRKSVIAAGMLLGVLTYFPLFSALTAAANPMLHAAQQQGGIVVTAPAGTCTFQFNPTGSARFVNDCDVARSLLAARGAAFSLQEGEEVTIDIAGTILRPSEEGFADTLAQHLISAGYPAPGDPSIIKVSGLFDIFTPQALTALGIMSLLALYGSMVYAPIAALLVELFPPQIRTTAISLPYNLGNGWIGGLLPATSFALVVHSGDIYFGLWYPVLFSALSFVVCLLFVPETLRRAKSSPAIAEG